MRFADFWSGMVTRPWIASPVPSAVRSCCSLTDAAVGLTALGCCALAGAAIAMINASASAPMMKRACATNLAMLNLLDFLAPLVAAGGVIPAPPRLRRDGFAIRRLPAPSAGAVAALRNALLVDLRDDLTVAGEQRLGGAHLRAQRQLASREPVRAVFFELRSRAVGFRAARTVRALVHLAARTEVADARILRRAERARVEAIAAADAQVLRVQYHGIRRGVEAVHRTHRRAGRVGAVHAGHRDRALAGHAVIDRHDAAAVDAPRHLVLVLAGGDAGVALDATIGVAEEFHTGHGRCSLSRANLTEGGFRLLHAGDRIEAVGRERVDAFAKHHRIGARRILRALVDPLEPAREVEWTPSDAFADTRRYQRLHPRLGCILSPRHPDPATVLDAAIGGVRRINLDEHVLLQFGEPLVRARLFA